MFKWYYCERYPKVKKPSKYKWTKVPEGAQWDTVRQHVVQELSTPSPYKKHRVSRDLDLSARRYVPHNDCNGTHNTHALYL